MFCCCFKKLKLGQISLSTIGFEPKEILMFLPKFKPNDYKTIIQIENQTKNIILRSSPCFVKTKLTFK